MASVRDFPEILEQCLQAIDSGTATIEACVSSHPDVEDLREMLEAAAVVRASAAVRASMATDRKEALEQRLMQQFTARKPVPRARQVQWWRVPAMAAAMLLVLLFSGIG